MEDDEDYAELALEPAAVDRLMGGQYLVEHLSALQPRKRQRAPIVDQEQPEHEPLCGLSDVEDADETDDGADALIAAFGHSDPNQNQKPDQPALSKTLPHTSSMLATPVCCCGRVSRSSLEEDATQSFDPHTAYREYLDLHIRYAVVVRVVRVETVKNHAMFVLKVSDAETQKRWEVKKTLKELMQFYSQIQNISLEDASVKRPLWGTFRGLMRFHLPKKILHFRGSLNTQRRMVFDSFLRQTAALVAPVPLGPRRRKAVLLLQEFVDVHRHCDVFDRGGCTCFFLKNQVNASQLVDEIFAAPSHQISRACEAFVAALTNMSRDDKHVLLSEPKARTLLNTVSRKMGEINTPCL